MSWASDTKLRLQFFAIFMTILCPGFLVWMAPDALRQIASYHWPTVPGEVQSTLAKTWTNSDRQIKFFGRVSYRYRVDGKEYTSDLTDLGPGTKRSSQIEALDDVREFAPGMKVVVYYDPANPAIGVIQNSAAYRAGWNLPFSAEKGWCWLAVGLLFLLGLALIAGGVALVYYCRSLMSHRVEICPNGFRYCSGPSADNVLWADVAKITETILYERPPILKGAAKLLLPKVASSIYSVATKTGKTYGFDGDSVKAIKRLGRLLNEQAERLALPWETVEVHN